MNRQPATPYTGPTTLGLDCSRWQDTDGDLRTVDVDFERAREAGCRFVVVRAADGKDVDPVAVRYLDAAARAGHHCAVYVYFRGHRDPVLQAKHALEVVRMAGVRPLFVALDWEGTPQREDGSIPTKHLGAYWTPDGGGVPRELVIQRARRFVERIQRAGIRVVLYGGQTLHYQVAQLAHPPEWALSLPLWVASYREGEPIVPVLRSGHPAWPEWSLWQYTGKGRISGVKGPVDLNRFRGDEDALRAFGQPRPTEAPPVVQPGSEGLVARLVELAVEYPAHADLLDGAARKVAAVG